LAQKLLIAKTMPGAVAQEVCQWQKYNTGFVPIDTTQNYMV
jgi:hypothetical protein